MYDDELILIKREEEIVPPGVTQDIQDIRTTVFCNVRNAKISERYLARTDTPIPEFVFTIHSFEYNGEEIVEYNGECYAVTYVYKISGTEEIELSVVKKTGV